MPVSHLEILVEEVSMEAFLYALLPRLLPEGITFAIHASQGKTALLRNLEARLRGYACWIGPEVRIIVVVDRDDDNCDQLKSALEAKATTAGLISKTAAAGNNWKIANRIAIEELEAWYFGEWSSVRAVYPRAAANVPGRKQYRDPDAIVGGTWEAFERVMNNAGYFKSGLRKLEVARAIGAVYDPVASLSNSFIVFRDAVLEAVS